MVNADEYIIWSYGFAKLNLTILTTWVLMVILAVGAWLITRRLTAGTRPSKWQSVLEILVLGMEGQIRDIGIREPRRYLPFLGTIFLFIALAALATLVPGYTPPTSSLSTTTALALAVFVAVPFFGIAKNGLGGYLRTYFQPSFVMLPFNIISELSRTIALAFRLFGNMLSGVVILSILLSIAPFFFPIIMSMLGLLTGMVQAYIFSMLAAVFIAAALREGRREKATQNQKTDQHG